MGTENHFQLRTGSKSSDSLEMRFPPRFFFYQHRQVFLTDVKLVRHCRELSTRRSHGGGEESVHFKKKYSGTITEIGPVRRIGYGTGQSKGSYQFPSLVQRKSSGLN